ncbi:MAG TPA: hypothetical protein VF478_08385 [Anaerolineae bacterium]
MTSTPGLSVMDARAEAPAPSNDSGFLPVQDAPPSRETTAMTVDEQMKLQKELIAARDRQMAKARGGAGRAEVKPQQLRDPAN